MSIPPSGVSPQPKPRRRGRIILFSALVLIVALVACIATAVATSSGSPSSTANTPHVTATTPPQAHYPPRTEADLHGLAAQGNSSVLHLFHSASVGLTGACPQPEREVTVAGSITGKQLAEDLLAYFYGQHLDSPCGSVLFADHSKGDAGNGYTVGRLLLDVTNGSGQSNTDPQATGLRYTLTLDVGSVTDEQEYVVSW